jgi:glucokinase
MKVLGIDIGGTKCALTVASVENENVEFIHKESFATADFKSTLGEIIARAKALVIKFDGLAAAGISCGGPLDSKRGVIMSPPNLPGWDDIHIVDILSEELGIPVGIQNDANACALAEWKFGAGKGTRNMVFMTFGTGLGAGLIIDGRLYAGTNDNAGEVGHIRLADYGPVGFGKSGSYEGFCSGGGIAQLAKAALAEKFQMGQSVSWCTKEQLDTVTAKMVAEAADQGDEIALSIMRTSARKMGFGISLLIDILNPEMIVLGSIYARNEAMMKPYIEEIIQKEALGLAAKVCCVKPAALGEKVGDYAAVSVAVNIL